MPAGHSIFHFHLSSPFYFLIYCLFGVRRFFNGSIPQMFHSPHAFRIASFQQEFARTPLKRLKAIYSQERLLLKVFRLFPESSSIPLCRGRRGCCARIWISSRLNARNFARGHGCLERPKGGRLFVFQLVDATVKEGRF